VRNCLRDFHPLVLVTYSFSGRLGSRCDLCHGNRPMEVARPSHPHVASRTIPCAKPAGKGALGLVMGVTARTDMDFRESEEEKSRRRCDGGGEKDREARVAGEA